MSDYDRLGFRNDILTRLRRAEGALKMRQVDNTKALTSAEIAPDAGSQQADQLDVATLIASGLLNSVVFPKDVLSGMGGSLVILDSDVLDADMTAADDCPLTIQGKTAFAVGDILRIKDAADDEWFEVTDASAAPTYSVLRDRGPASPYPGEERVLSDGDTRVLSDGDTRAVSEPGYYPPGENPLWKRGLAVVNYGQSGGGGVQLVAGAAPEISIFTHSGSPWSDLVKHVQMLRELVAFGANVLSPSTTAQRTFHVDQVYNGENMGAGDWLLGDNSSGRPNLLWDASAGELQFRSGTIVLNRMAAGALQADGCKLHRSTNQNAPSSPTVYTVVSFDEEVYDDSAYADLGTNPTRITIPAGHGGRYRVGCFLSFDATFAGTAYIVVNNTYAVAAISLTALLYVNLFAECELQAGDYIEVQIAQNSGSTQHIVAGTDKPAMWLERCR